MITYRELWRKDGWCCLVDISRRQSGRYCDSCNKRIDTEEPYYPKSENVHTTVNPSKDYCEDCFNKRDDTKRQE